MPTMAEALLPELLSLSLRGGQEQRTGRDKEGAPRKTPPLSGLEKLAERLAEGMKDKKGRESSLKAGRKRPSPSSSPDEASFPRSGGKGKGKVTDIGSLVILEEGAQTARGQAGERKEQSWESDSGNAPAKISYTLFIPSEGPAQLGYGAFSIRYSTSPGEERVSIEAERFGNPVSLSASKPSPLLEQERYALSVEYDAQRKGFVVQYSAEDYAENIQKARGDFTHRLDKFLEIVPSNLMGGVLGFTYLGMGKMWRRDDLFGEMAELVDVHEAIHTPDEYETRILTTWMLRREMPKYRV